MRAYAFTLAAVLAIPVLPQSSFSDAMRDGKILFHKYCAACHGEEATGQDPSRPAGGWLEDGSRIAPALNGTAHSWHHDPELLFSYVRDGSPDPESPMPSFGKRLNDDQIWAITGYYQSLWPGRIRKIYDGRFPGSFSR